MSETPLYSLTVPTTLEYRLHSKYWSRRHYKPHDFTIELVADFEFNFFDILTCNAPHLYFKGFRDRYAITIQYHGKEVTINLYDVDNIRLLRLTAKLRKRSYSVRYIGRLLKEDRNKIIERLRVELGITKALATGIANDILNYLVNGIEPIYKYFTVERAKYVDVEEVYRRVRLPIEKYYPDEYEMFLRTILLAIDEIVSEWFREVLQWDYPVEGELSELDGGVSLDQNCGTILGARELTEEDVIQSSIRLTYAEYRKANAYDVEPVDVEYWSETLRQFLEERIDEISNAIWRAYELYILPIIVYKKEAEV